MSGEDRRRWNEKYGEPHWRQRRDPFPLLARFARPRPDGLALDLACGLGHNTLWLARQGYRALGVDISRVALRRAVRAARRQKLADRVLFVEADLDHFVLLPRSFDLICIFRFLNRSLFPAIQAALRPGGQLIYATLNWRRLHTHPDTPARFVLQPGELVVAFPGLSVEYFDETGDLSSLVARRPPDAG